MKYSNLLIITASLLIVLAICSNQENLTNISESIKVYFDSYPPQFQISQELFSPPYSQDLNNGEIQYYSLAELNNCSAKYWILNNNEEYVCINFNNTEISIFDVNDEFSFINQTNLSQVVQYTNPFIQNEFIIFALQVNQSYNIEIFNSLTNQFIAIFNTELNIAPMWSNLSGLLYFVENQNEEAYIGFYSYENETNIVIKNLTGDSMGVKSIQTFQNNTILLAYMNIGIKTQIIAILIANGTEQGTPMIATGTPVQVNDTHFIIQDNPIISLCTINSTNLEIIVWYSINISQYFVPDFPFSLNYLIGVPQIQVTYNNYAFLYISFDQNGFTLLRAVSRFPFNDQENQVIYPPSFNLSSNLSVIFNEMGYWLSNVENITFVQFPNLCIFLQNYDMGIIWGLSINNSENIEGDPYTLIEFNSQTENITTYNYLNYPCNFVLASITAIIPSPGNPPTLILSCPLDLQFSNYVQTPINTYGPFKSSASKPCLNTEDATISFASLNQISQGLSLVSYNYALPNSSPNTSSLVDNYLAIASKISENLMLAASPSLNNNEEFSFQVYNITSAQFIQNFTAPLPYQPEAIYPHSINLSSNLPVQSLIISNSKSRFGGNYYELSVNLSQTQSLNYLPLNSEYINTISTNKALFLSQKSIIRNFEVVEYIGPLPVPQPPPSPSSGTRIAMSLLAMIGIYFIT